MMAAACISSRNKNSNCNKNKGTKDSSSSSSSSSLRLDDLLLEYNSNTTSCCNNHSTLRLEHRWDPSQKERFLLFCSDRPGCIGKVIFTSQASCSSSSSSSSNDSVATARIHAIEVKEEFRGYDLGGLLFHQVISYLASHYYSKEQQLLQQQGEIEERNSSQWFTYANRPVVLLLLDAEEDTRRHNKLRHFYEWMGCTVLPDARIRYLHNNDVEIYRKIPMQMSLRPLVLKQSQKREDRMHHKHQSLVGSSFVPLLFMTTVSSSNNQQNPNDDGGTLSTQPVHVTQTLQQQQGYKKLRHVDWIVLDEKEHGISFQTTQGLYLYATPDGKIITDGGPPPDKLNLPWIYFQLQRVYDCNDPATSSSCLGQDTTSSGTATSPTNENCKQLWTIQTCHGTFLCVNKDKESYNNGKMLTTANYPVFWAVHTTGASTNNKYLCLLCLRDTPERRRYYQQWWTYQDVTYNKAMRERYLQLLSHKNNINNKLSLKEALLQKAKLLPWYRFPRGTINSNRESLSLRSFLFHCAETARILGEPDWVQLTALLHGLGRIVSLLDNNQDNELQSFDWTLSKSSMIVGCSPPPSAKFVEYYPRFNADYLSCNTKLGIYTEHCGLRNVLLSWSASEYLYCWLRFHKNNIPEEGLAMIRFLHLKYWYSRHKQNYYHQLTDETDEDMKPFVSEFERLIYHAKKTFTTEVSDEECTRLWEQFYHPICNKYDFDDSQLQW